MSALIFYIYIMLYFLIVSVCNQVENEKIMILITIIQKGHLSQLLIEVISLRDKFLLHEKTLG